MLMLRENEKCEGKHKGFAFLEFELPEDAAAAMDNMHQGKIPRDAKCGFYVDVRLYNQLSFMERQSHATWRNQSNKTEQKQVSDEHDS